MDQKIKIPYAVLNYEEIITKGYYYIDKTNYIEKLEQYKAPVFLRPRRFGKTLFCSVLKNYYDINNVNNFSKLFAKTYIGQHPTVEKNAYLVLSFNFSKVAVANNIKEIEQSFTNICLNAITSFLKYYENYFSNFILKKDDKISDILDNINNYRQNYNLPELFIIIDEYDNFTNQLIQSNNDSLYKQITSDIAFFKTFFKVIKAGIEECNIKRCYITGVLPITIDDLTSGFNVAELITLNAKFSNLLGFTEDDVNEYLVKIFTDYAFEQKNFLLIKTILQKYYNGYLFINGKQKLYNSTIIAYFFKEFIDNNGNIPEFFIDTNIKTDLNWLERLTLKT